MKKRASMKVVNGYKYQYFTNWDMSRIMCFKEADFYNDSGIYGWNNDIYLDPLEDIAIMEGYRNFRGKKIPRKIYLKYNGRAKKIYDFKTSYEHRLKVCKNNYLKMIEELKAL